MMIMMTLEEIRFAMILVGRYIVSWYIRIINTICLKLNMNIEHPTLSIGFAILAVFFSRKETIVLIVLQKNSDFYYYAVFVVY